MQQKDSDLCASPAIAIQKHLILANILSKSIGKRIFQHSFRNDIDLFAKGILQIVLEISQSKQAKRLGNSA